MKVQERMLRQKIGKSWGLYDASMARCGAIRGVKGRWADNFVPGRGSRNFAENSQVFRDRDTWNLTITTVTNIFIARSDSDRINVISLIRAFPLLSAIASSTTRLGSRETVPLRADCANAGV
jgi:hypothetical protein